MYVCVAVKFSLNHPKMFNTKHLKTFILRNYLQLISDSNLFLSIQSFY